MKTKLSKATSRFSDESSIGMVHLDGAIDGSACGLDYEDYVTKDVLRSPITCSTCLTYYNWAKNVAKINNSETKPKIVKTNGGLLRS